jgi:hypothetical protein
VLHEDWGLRHGVLDLQVSKPQCRGRYSRQPLPGFRPCQRASEAVQLARYEVTPPLVKNCTLRQQTLSGIGNHTFRATGITAYLRAWARSEAAPLIANDEGPRTTNAL